MRGSGCTAWCGFFGCGGDVFNFWGKFRGIKGWGVGEGIFGCERGGCAGFGYFGGVVEGEGSLGAFLRGAVAAPGGGHGCCGLVLGFFGDGFGCVELVEVLMLMVWCRIWWINRLMLAGDEV